MASPDDEQRSGLTDAAGRAALFSARAAARVWRDQFETAVDEVLSAPEIARSSTGPSPDRSPRSRALARPPPRPRACGRRTRRQRRARAPVDRGAGKPANAGAHRSRDGERRDAAGPPARRVEPRASGRSQPTDPWVHGRGRRRHADVRRADGSTGRVSRAPPRARRPPGLRGHRHARPRLAADAFATILIYLGIVGVVALIASLVGGLRPQWLVGVLLLVGWVVIAGGYFVLFWSSAGQTLGMRLLRLRVRTAAGDPPSVGRSIVRVIGLVLAIVPLFLGFVPVLFDERSPRTGGLHGRNDGRVRRRRSCRGLVHRFDARLGGYR